MQTASNLSNWRVIFLPDRLIKQSSEIWQQISFYFLLEMCTAPMKSRMHAQIFYQRAALGFFSGQGCLQDMKVDCKV